MPSLASLSVKVTSYYRWALSHLSNRILLALTISIGTAVLAVYLVAISPISWTPVGIAILSVLLWTLKFAGVVSSTIAFLARKRNPQISEAFTIAGLFIAFIANGIPTFPAIPPNDISKVEMSIANTDSPSINLSKDEARVAKGMTLPQVDEEVVGEGELALSRFPDAINHFSDAERILEDKLANVHFYKARAFWGLAESNLALPNDGLVDKALLEANLSLGFRPMYSPALVIKCVCLRDQNRLEEARHACDDAVDADKNNQGAWNALGGTLITQGDQKDLNPRPYYEMALADLNQGIKLHGTRELWTNRAMALESLGQYPEALQAVEKALDMSPDFSNALLEKGVILKKSRKWPEAIATYHKITDLNPSDAEAWNNLGIVSEKKGLYDEALIYFDQALRLKPALSEALFSKGQLLNVRHRYGEAIEPLQSECKLRPRDAEARYQLAFALYEGKRRSEALSKVSEALHIRPHYRAALSLQQGIRDGSEVVLDRSEP